MATNADYKSELSFYLEGREARITHLTKLNEKRGISMTGEQIMRLEEVGERYNRMLDEEIQAIAQELNIPLPKAKRVWEQRGNERAERYYREHPEEARKSMGRSIEYLNYFAKEHNLPLDEIYRLIELAKTQGYRPTPEVRGFARKHNLELTDVEHVLGEGSIIEDHKKDLSQEK